MCLFEKYCCFLTNTPKSKLQALPASVTALGKLRKYYKCFCNFLKQFLLIIFIWLGVIDVPNIWSSYRSVTRHGL